MNESLFLLSYATFINEKTDLFECIKIKTILFLHVFITVCPNIYLNYMDIWIFFTLYVIKLNQNLKIFEL